MPLSQQKEILIINNSVIKEVQNRYAKLLAHVIACIQLLREVGSIFSSPKAWQTRFERLKFQLTRKIINGIIYTIRTETLT